MGYLFNFFYLLALLLLSPWLLCKSITTGKYRRGMLAKFLGRVDHPLLRDLSTARHPSPATRHPTPIVWFHGVSVGEIHLLRQVVARFRQRRPDCACVISTTTETGYDEAREIFADLPVVLWPLDFTWAVRQALDTIRPNLVVLAEGELWPNFLRTAKRRAIRLAIVNGRMSPRSCGRFRKIRWLVRPLFAQLDLIAAQTPEYAEYYRLLGATNVHVTGSVKYDGAQGDRANPRTESLRGLFGIQPGDLVWIAGSTQAPEEEIVLDIYRRLKEKHPRLWLVIVPRQKDRFEEVAHLLERSGLPFRRRSGNDKVPGWQGDKVKKNSVTLSPCHPVILVDTIGELSAVWGLADVAFVGGSLDGKRGGQNMIEPAAYGAAVVFGPHTWNFKETVAQLLTHQAALRIADSGELESETARLLADAALRERLGTAARQFVLAQQGATEKTLQLLDGLLPPLVS